MRAVKIPPEERMLLLLGRKHITRLTIIRARYLTRWMGQLPAGGVLTPTGLAAGCCGHYSFFRLPILLHTHPQDRPVPEDMRLALEGKGPVPDWFLQGRWPSRTAPSPAAARTAARRRRDRGSPRHGRGRT